VTGEGETPTATHLQIGQVAERTELSIRTLRHWEVAGLVRPSARSAGGFVADCHTRAKDSCTTLRRQLTYAEEFRDLLADRG
jgi:hypothetical protein